MTRCAWIVLGLVAAGCYRTPVPVVANQVPVQRAPSRFKQVTYRYCEQHEVPIVCDSPPPGEDMCPEEAEDVLELRSLHNGKLAVAISLMRTNGHTCTFDGELSRARTSEPGTERWTFSESNEDSDCTVELVKGETAIDITSTGCRDYCGVRAILDARFDTTEQCPGGPSLFDRVD
jgi:hypothetical protein